MLEDVSGGDVRIVEDEDEDDGEGLRGGAVSTSLAF